MPSRAPATGVPEAFSRFVAAFGVAAGIDPYLLFVVDLMAGNHGCASKCFDYTSPSCRCHVGDAWKLYDRLDAEEGAGISGALLTILVSGVFRFGRYCRRLPLRMLRGLLWALLVDLALETTAGVVVVEVVL